MKIPSKPALNSSGNICLPARKGVSDFMLDEFQEQSFRDKKNWGIDELQIPVLWAKGVYGKDTKVAVIDTGIYREHPDLKGSVEKEYNFLKNNCNANDDSGHGTLVAGIIASRNNNLGYIGVAPRCKLLIAKVLDENRRMGSAANLVDAINWSIDEGADVINISILVSEDYSEVREAIRRAWKAKIPVVCAAGNEKFEDKKLRWPAAYKKTIAVGAVHKRSMQVSHFSSEGPELNVLAPGDPVYSTFLKPKLYMKDSGTSYAAPFVSGTLALYLSSISSKPKVKYLKKFINRSAKNLLKDRISERPDIKHGWGMLSPVAFHYLIK